VKVIYLPDAADGSKQGVDDYLAAGGTVKEMFVLARKFNPADVGRVRLSRDERLHAGVEDLERRWWAEEWKGRGGHTERDLALKLIEAAPKSGTIHADGIRVKVSWGKLQVWAKVARKTLAKALARLEERGFLYRDNAGRKADKTGAFVLRARVDQYGKRAPQVTPELRTCDRGGLPLRAPRLRWSRPKFTPRRGTVHGTRKVRESKPQQPRERIERLGKIRGAIVDALEVAGGTLTLQELCEVLHRARPRDVRRRILPMLEEAGIIETAEDVITLAADWTRRLDDARAAGGEVVADELAEERRKRNSRAYHERDKVQVSKPSAAGLDAVRRSREKAREHRRENLIGWVEDTTPATPSPLAVAVRDYLDKHPRDARQPAGWIGSTLWALEHFEGKPTPAETKAAIEELGGAEYLDGILRRAKETVA
jgi:ribosomal protein S19E (S16A)